MKRLFAVALCVLVLAASAATASNQAWVFPSSNTAKVGESFFVWGHIATEDPINAAEYALSFPGDLVQVEGQSITNSVLSMVGVITPTYGAIGAVNDGFMGTGLLTCFQVRAIKPGAARFNLTNFRALAGPDAHEVPFTVGPDAVIKITAVPEPSTLLCLAIAIPSVAAILRRRVN